MEAVLFHKMASPVLSELGFDLIADPSRVLNRYRLTAATYKSKRGLFLTVAFDPVDSNSASVSCGRQWRRKNSGFSLSNNYSVLAKRFGIDVPAYYQLGYSDEIVRTMERLLDDLKRTLPVVMERTTREDLIAIESEPSGAVEHAAAHDGADYVKHYEISDY